jgi:hypothetical protein
MKLLPLLSLAAFSSVVFACSAAPDPASGAEAPLQSNPSAAADIDTSLVSNDTPITTDACPMVPGPSKAGNDGAWVRGVAHFDPSHFKAGAKPVLRVVLRHSFALVKGEEKIGGRLHGWTSVPIDDPSAGEVSFAIDMAENHTMWSEGNGTFHVVLIIDEDDNNNLDFVTTQTEAMVAGVVGPNELAKIVDVDISCHAPSPCLDVQIDCVGASCTEITPVKTCKKKLPACADDADFCQD